MTKISSKSPKQKTYKTFKIDKISKMTYAPQKFLNNQNTLKPSKMAPKKLQND